MFKNGLIGAIQGSYPFGEVSLTAFFITLFLGMHFSNSRPIYIDIIGIISGQPCKRNPMLYDLCILLYITKKEYEFVFK